MAPRFPDHLPGSLVVCIILSLFVVFSGCTAQSGKASGASSSASPQVQEGTVTVTGGKVWYRIAGADRPGIPLIVVHGGPGAPHDYLEPLEALANERPVIFYDQLGCGNSPCPDDPSLWTIGRFVDELEQVRAALSPGEVHILGQSWGTTLVSEYMITRKPAGVTSLIFSAPCLSVKRWEADQRQYLTELPEKERTTILACEETGNFSSPEYQDAMMTYYLLHLCRLEEWPDSMNRTFEKMGVGVYTYMWGPSEFTMAGTLKDFDQSPNLHEISVPVLFTCGRYDEATPESTAYYLSMLPGSELIIFEDASHMHHIEKTDEYLSVVREFLRRSEDHLSNE
ncbi:proline iminopeptidase-family hydrolase [Methanogenium sp. S4BF]|uniref:proline iminopeptidase-family hydrolase n=1 Tax=Methanogenium sp. S4BF TaxID=1789226 RepID=UPI0024172DA6|nr:proline iminopeptidase-family hydrolase [Methanogenium sp. S4BF]WFN34971.1 proline iminopeptidase-family hydrolase [Methanogenium sp. S4BF]